MKGTIRKINDVTGEGRIEDETGEILFFFLSNVTKGIPFVDAKVDFQTKLTKNGGKRAYNIALISEQNTPSITATDPLITNALREIADWKLDAKLENNERYFFAIPELGSIENGSKCYVLGRKGAGKTSISEYLNKRTQYDIFSDKLTFKNFPFNELYNLKDNKYTYPNIYITLWKYIIYSSVAMMMSKNQSVDWTIRDKLQKIYSQDIGTSLPRTISRWTSKNINLLVLNSGIQIGGSKTINPNDVPWIERVEILEDIISRYAGTSKYYVIFDELDEDYQDLSDPEFSNRYTTLLIGLFKAVQDVKSSFTNRTNILPVIFLRDDIYSQLMDSDKTKWLDLSIHLSWDIPMIKNLLAFRISRALEPNCNIYDFENSWGKICSARYVAGYKPRLPFEYISQRTLSRPRDYIQFLKLCAEDCLKNGGNSITSVVIFRSTAAYSSYFKSEFQDELHPMLPIAQVFDVLSKIGKRQFRSSEFAQNFRSIIGPPREGQIGPDKTLEILFDFSVIGNCVPSTTNTIYKYIEPQAKFNPNRTVEIHSGLCNALMIK